MKTINLAIIASSILLLVCSVAHADELRSNINHQNISKRPYQEVLSESAYNKKDNWEGATLIDDDAEGETAGSEGIKRININNLGKRPYME